MKKLVLGVVVAMLASITAVLQGVAFAPSVFAAPGDPGNPADPQVLFTEDFENDMADGEVVTLADYVGANGETYSAEGAWANPAAMNGFVLDGTSTDAAQTAVGNTGGYSQLRTLARSLGTLNGTSPVELNHAVAAYTGGIEEPVAGDVEFRTDPALDLAVANRFLTFSVNVGVVNCHASHPLLRFYLDDGTQELPVTSAPLDPCPDGSRQLVSDGSVLFTGSDLGIVLRNEQGSAGGNDHAFDDIKVLDATPQLDKAFTPGTTPSGFPTALRFVVTNTSELASKEGWSFTDNLPAGMEIASEPSFSTDCANGAITSGGAAGDTDVALTGDLSAGQASCFLSIDVVTPGATAGAEFTNDASNIDDLVGLNPPGSSTLTVGPRVLPQVDCDPAAVRATQRWWHFGNGGGLDFGASGAALPVALPSTGQTASEGTTVVTDVNGNLLFWADGENVYDKSHAVMSNGSGLTGNISATQTVAAFPSLTQVGTYFVVTTSGAEATNGQLRYSVVDMTLNGGLGDVTATKDVDLGPAASAAEGLTAIPNGDGTGFWVVSSQNSSPNVRAYLFDGSGPADPDGAGPLAAGDAVVSVMPTPNLNQYSSFNLSPDLATVLMTTTQLGGNETTPSRIRLLDFDAALGRFNQRLEWASATTAGSGQRLYTADFSPSGDYVYATKIFDAAHLWRYQIAGAADGAAVKATETDLGLIGTAGQVRRGPDGRMYVANRDATALGVVDAPDAPVAGDVGFDNAGLPLAAGTTSRYGLPQMVTGCPTTPGLDLVKASALTTDNGTPGEADADDVITYTFTVHNSGYVPIDDVTVQDPLPGLSALSPASVATLAPNTDAVFTATYTVTQDDVDNGADIVNTAAATGTDPTGTPVTSPPGPGSTTTTTVAAANPDVQVLKSSAITTDEVPLGKADEGDVITYTFTATNHGGATAFDVSVDDALPGLGAISPASVATIAPGASNDFTATYTVTAADVLAKKIENTASVTSTGPTRGGVTPPPVTVMSNTVNTPTGPLGAPSILTKAANKVTLKVRKNGQPKAVRLHDSVTVSGMVPGGNAQGTATLYGPVTSPSAAMCTPALQVGSVSFAPANGTVDTPSVKVTEPGYYTWVVSTSADRRNLSATHACGLASETTLVHRPDVGKVKIETGFTGTDNTVAGRRVRPGKVKIAAIGMKAELRTVRVRKGSMVIPNDVKLGGWLRGSAAPGEAIGSTVIAGHVSDRSDRPGQFKKLHKARKGQVIKVRGADGTKQKYRITKTYTQARTKGFSGADVSTTGKHQLTLVTCTGKVTYRNGNFHYTKNLVVVATPIG